jgi:hypothetical protein
MDLNTSKIPNEKSLIQDIRGDITLNKVLLFVFSLFVIASLADVLTTYIGLTSGFVEQTEFVRILWIQFGLFGLILTKVISIVALTLISAPFYIFEKKLTKLFASTLYMMGTILFGYAAIHNLILLGYI